MCVRNVEEWEGFWFRRGFSIRKITWCSYAFDQDPTKESGVWRCRDRATMVAALMEKVRR